MANKDFDTTIVRPLERPLSSDLDAMQSQAYRTLRDVFQSVFSVYSESALVGVSPVNGFLSNGFKPIAGSGLNINLTPGIGFEYRANAESTIDGVVGLNDLSNYKPFFLSSAKTLTVPSVPAAGLCRRDIIQVRAQYSLTDSSSKYLWNVNTNTFSPQSVSSTLTYDLVNSDVQYLNYNELASLTAPFVYRYGQTVPYASPDDLLNAPVPVNDSANEYVTIGIVNVVGGSTSVGDSDIIDYRKMLMPLGKTKVSLSLNVSEEMATVNTLVGSVIPGAKFTAIIPNGATTAGDQAVEFILFLPGLGAEGNANSKYQVNNQTFSISPTPSVAYTINEIPLQGRCIDGSIDCVKVSSVTENTVTDAVKAIIAGTDADYTSVNPFDAPIGARYISLGGYFGTFYRSDLGATAVLIRKLSTPASLYTFSAQADITAL